MGLADDLDIRLSPAGGVRRAIGRLGSTRGGSWLLSQVLHRLDLFVSWATRGRRTATEGVIGLPVIELDTVGAKTGKLRTSPLLAIPADGEVFLVGSGWGQPRTPGWVYNLRSRPECVVRSKGHSAEVVGVEVEPSTAASVLALGAEHYPGFAKYPQRAAHRRISVFRLDRR